MTRALALAVLTAFAICCGPSTKPADPTPAPVPTEPAPDTLPSHDPGKVPIRDPGTVPIRDPESDSRARCEKLIDHMIDVAASEHPEANPAEIREAMTAERGRLVDECAAGVVTDAELDCVMAATSEAEMKNCGPR